MNKSTGLFGINTISSFVLLFCVTFSLTFYNSLAKEYEYNLKIDRGFVSGDAVYFSLQKNSDSGEPSPESEINSNIEFLDILAGYCSADSFLLSSQIGNTRAIYYRGDFELPPIRSGRFFHSSECTIREKYAVIGQGRVDQTWKDPSTNKTMISLEQGDFEVIGIMGMEKTSTIDNMVFVNLGSIDEEVVLSSVLFVDSYSGKSDQLFTRLANFISAESKFSPEIIDMPFTATDVVSGGVFMASLLKVIVYIFLFISFLCTLVFSIRSNQTKLPLYLLNGHTYIQSLRWVSIPLLISGVTGIALAFISGVIVEKIQFFNLPSIAIYSSLGLSCLIGFSMLLLFPFFQYFAIRSINLSESLR